MRSRHVRGALPLVAWLTLCGSPGAAQDLPRSSLSVSTPDGWRTIWRSDRAPARWHGPDARVVDALEWRNVGDGVELAELRLAGKGQAWRIGLIVVRIDTHRLDLKLQSSTRDRGTLGAWTTDSIAAGETLAFNAGQFSGGTPWGWVVRDGEEVQAPGTGPLSMALIMDAAGDVRLVSAASIPAVRSKGVALAFQSYPMLLDEEGRVPEPLRGGGRGVDVEHRDSRLALGILEDGRLLVVLTRFEGLGGALSGLPFGPTIPELAGIMGALGCRSAVALDGGISGQLAVRGADGRISAWQGLRRVPLAFVAAPRAENALAAGVR